MKSLWSLVRQSFSLVWHQNHWLLKKKTIVWTLPNWKIFVLQVTIKKIKIQAHMREIAGLVVENHNKVNFSVKQVTWTSGFPVRIKAMFSWHVCNSIMSKNYVSELKVLYCWKLLTPTLKVSTWCGENGADRLAWPGLPQTLNL